MNGEIAVLYQSGKQVAGVYDWQISVWFENLVVNEVKEYLPRKEITARSYWLVKPVKKNEFDIEFYQRIQDSLVLMDTGKVVVRFPDTKTLNRRLDTPIEMRWIKGEY